MRVGQGWDLHRLEEGRTLVVGGMVVPSKRGCVAHSDGDVLLHAIIDALLGAAAFGDIGRLFPDTSIDYQGISSEVLFNMVYQLITEEYYLVNLDSTIILEKPKLAEYMDEIRENIARLFQVDVTAISIKAKTSERVNAVGEERAIEAYVTLLLEEK